MLINKKKKLHTPAAPQASATPEPIANGINPLLPSLKGMKAQQPGTVSQKSGVIATTGAGIKKHGEGINAVAATSEHVVTAVSQKHGVTVSPGAVTLGKSPILKPFTHKHAAVLPPVEPGSFEPYQNETEEASKVLRKQLKELESWALTNKREAKKNAIRFWMLKIPAITVSVSAGIFAHFHLQIIALIAGAIASLCILIDGLNPGGQLRNVHLRAYFDLRNLQQNMLALWREGNLKAKNKNELAAKIIESVKLERNRIHVYVRDAEITLGDKSK